ncbi:MAG: hypothetical protein HC767_06055 [Akkermansiaceae bacterium]|nr:hypothetical protein [Akkermansiaceae bacterium]
MFREQVVRERKAAKQRKKDSAAKKRASEHEAQASKRQKAEHDTLQDPTMTWEQDSGLYKHRAKQHTGGGRSVGPPHTRAGPTVDVEMSGVVDKQAIENATTTGVVNGSKEGVGTPNVLNCKLKDCWMYLLPCAIVISVDPFSMSAGCASNQEECSCRRAVALSALQVVKAQLDIGDVRLFVDDTTLQVNGETVQVHISSYGGICNVQLSPISNPLKRKAADVAAEGIHGGKENEKQAHTDDTADPVYTTFQDFYERKYNIKGLSETLPLMNVRRFPMQSSAPNCLVPATQGSRRNEILRASQHEVIDKALSDAQELLQGKVEVAAAGDPGVAADGAAVGPKLVPELCSVHPLCLSTLQALQFMPSLMYRLEVTHHLVYLILVHRHARFCWSLSK